MAGHAHPGLASPQPVRVANMNFGQNAKDFMTNPKKEEAYKKVFPSDVEAMLRGRDIACITEIVPRWYRWLLDGRFFSNSNHSTIFPIFLNKL